MAETSKAPDVVAVQCPKCHKYVLVEAHDVGKTVNCLICKAPILVGAAPPESLQD